MNEELQRRLSEVSRQPGHIVPDDFDLSVNSQGQRSDIAEYRAGTAHMVRQGRSNPFRVAVPAYYGDTTDATGGNTETFNLPQSVVDAPTTQSVVVWLDGSYYGSPDAVDYQNDTIDVTDSGTASNLHVYYISDAPATLEVRKSVPNSSTDASQQLYSANLGLVHGSPQQEQPEFFQLGNSPLHPFAGTDMAVTAYIDAPYTVRWEDPDGDGTEPTNALLNIPVMVGQREVRGLTSAVKADMGKA